MKTIFDSANKVNDLFVEFGKWFDRILRFIDLRRREATIGAKVGFLVGIALLLFSLLYVLWGFQAGRVVLSKEESPRILYEASRICLEVFLFPIIVGAAYGTFFRLIGRIVGD
jgi:hypothetical protein